MITVGKRNRKYRRTRNWLKQLQLLYTQVCLALSRQVFDMNSRFSGGAETVTALHHHLPMKLIIMCVAADAVVTDVFPSSDAHLP